ncbi:MAG: 50S ribosomal protein L15 [Candidatus Nealsonbacteria bacterium]|nr:50S ribosomal protein L15 [Candidatus Nealsonbacteria bacterium]
MQLHQLKPTHSRKGKKRIGRGGKRGSYSGRGVKGQNVRAGAKFKPIIRELIKKYPKLRGYRFNTKIKNLVIINIGNLQKKFKENEKITPEILVDKKIIRAQKRNIPQIKILGSGEIKKVLIFEGFQFSKSAKEKIEKAGGSITNSKCKTQNAKPQLKAKNL